MKEIDSSALAIVCNRSKSRRRLLASSPGRRHPASGSGRELRRLTEGRGNPRLDLPDEHARHFRTVYLSLRRSVGEHTGLISGPDFCTQRPTRQMAWWVFPFANKSEHRWRSGQRAGLQNLYSRVRIPPGAPTLRSKRARLRSCRMAREQWNNA